MTNTYEYCVTDDYRSGRHLTMRKVDVENEEEEKDEEEDFGWIPVDIPVAQKDNIDGYLVTDKLFTIDTYHLGSWNKDLIDMDNLFEQLYSYYNNSGTFTTTGMTSAYKSEGYYKKPIQLTDTQIVNSNIPKPDSVDADYLFVVFIDENGIIHDYGLIQPQF